MRWIACTTLLMVAACGGATEQNNAATKAATLVAGQWELTSEVTAFNKADPGTPQIITTVGTRATESVCAPADRPPAELFGGPDYDCRYNNYYARNGRLNVTLMCGREGLQGNISVTASGDFETDSLDFERDVSTSLAGEGDVRITSRVTGRRTGDCTPEAPEGNGNGGAEG
jgi:hypothetical protein